jgi:hypothetical protein
MALSLSKNFLRDASSKCEAQCSAKSSGREKRRPVPYESAVGEKLAER